MTDVLFSLLTEQRRTSTLVNLFQPYVDAVEYLGEHDPKQIGIYQVGYSYPIILLINRALESTIIVEHVEVENVSQKLRYSSYKPQYIISTDESIENIGGVLYRIVWASPEVIISARDDIVGNTGSDMLERDILIIESSYDVYIRETNIILAA